VLFYKKSADKKVAFIASKKVGIAVVRNRAKRLLKAHFISFAENLNRGCYIYVAKQPILNSNYSQLNNTFKYIYKKLKLLK
jgi:ribonuclease P protein component